MLAWRLRPWLLVKQLLEGAIDETRRLVLGNWWLLVIRWVMGHRWLATSEKLAELRSKGLLTWQWLLNSCVCAWRELAGVTAGREPEAEWLMSD